MSCLNMLCCLEIHHNVNEIIVFQIYRFSFFFSVQGKILNRLPVAAAYKLFTDF